MDPKRLKELMLDPPDGELSMSCTKKGNVLKCGGETFELTEHQAGILFDGGLMLMARIRLAREQSPTPTESPDHA